MNAGKLARPVRIAAIAHCSAAGVDAATAARSIRAGLARPGHREVLGQRWPWFALPVDEHDWDDRARCAVQRLQPALSQDLDTGRWARIPLFLASSSLQAGALEAAARLGGGVALPTEAAAFAPIVAAWLGIATAPWTFSTSCTSGFAALDAACSLIACGLIDEAVVLGFEFANDATLAGFAGLGILAPAEGGKGLVLGEAVAAVRLQAGDGAGWRIAACALGLDGHSPTSPTPDGGPIAHTMQAALAAAGCSAAEIGLLKPHRAGLAATDEAEAAALTRVFGVALPPQLPLKALLGHTLGASGLAELTALIACLGQDTEQGRETADRVLLNLIGFGGGIGSLVIEAEPTRRGERQP